LKALKNNRSPKALNSNPIATKLSIIDDIASFMLHYLLGIQYRPYVEFDKIIKSGTKI